MSFVVWLGTAADPFCTHGSERRRSAAATTRTVTHLPSQPPTDLHLCRDELTILLQDRSATNTGVRYSLPDIVAMRKCDLVRTLTSVGQAVGKRQPTRLELLGAAVTLLCGMDTQQLLGQAKQSLRAPTNLNMRQYFVLPISVIAPI